MKKKRINDTVLASIPVQNGQILKGEHLATLRGILSAAVNENKYDIDRIVAGQDAVHVYGDNVDALDEYASENTVADETLGYLYTENQILLYKYITDAWNYLGVLNLTELFDKTQELDARITDLDAHDIPFNGSDTNYLVGETEIEGAIKELDTKVKANVNDKQDKLIAGDNISIEGNTISASGVDLNLMAYFNYAGSIYGVKYNLLASAWEHSLTVDLSEIMATSTTSLSRGLAQYLDNETEGIIIPHGVTSIGDYAFYSSNNNQALVIPNSVTSIGAGAFRDWTSNNHPLVIPNSVTSIVSYAFEEWSSNNKPLVISDSVTSIGIRAFRDWTSNTHPLVIPDSVTSIGQYAFENWTNVPYVEMKSTTPPTLNDANAFEYTGQNNTPIYVPDESVDDYKAATNWVDLADRIFSINDK